MSKPAWLKKGVLACHLPTATVFTPNRLYDKSGTLHLTDSNENEYRLSDCEELRLEHLRGISTLVTDSAALTIYPDPRGLIVTDGTRKLLVIPRDEGKEAAESLAHAFNGSIYSEEAS